jgi:hypothetical protein
MAAAFEDVDEADQVAVDIGMRVLQRVAHAGLRREIDHALRAFCREKRGDAGAVGDVEARQRKRGLGAAAPGAPPSGRRRSSR